MQRLLDFARRAGIGNSTASFPLPPGVQRVEIDPATGKGRVEFYKYLPEHNIWNRDTDVNPRSEDGVFSFVIERLAGDGGAECHY